MDIVIAEQNTQHTSLRLRAYPTATQCPKLAQDFGNCRFVYNKALALKIKEYEDWVAIGKPKGKRWLNYQDLQNMLPSWKTEFPWLSITSAPALQAPLANLAQAFSNWLSGRSEYPKFKHRTNRDTLAFSNYVVHTRKHLTAVTDRRLNVRLPKDLGVLRCVLSRPLPDGKLLRSTLSKEASGKYYISFTYEVDPITRQREKDIPRCGIDMGVVNPLTVVYKDTRGSLVHRVLGKGVKARLEKLERRRKRYQRVVARKQLAYNARCRKAKVDPKTGEINKPSCSSLNKAKCKVTLSYERERNVRKDFVEKVSTSLASNFLVIKFEDLKLSNMTKQVKANEDGTPRKGVAAKSGLNRELLRLGLASLVSRTEVKSHYYGSTVQYVNPRHTSQRCSSCGVIDKESRKSQARYKCVHCGFTLNADVNAGINILTRRPLGA